MDLKVKIISTETITPSSNSPAPKTYKLSLLDQLSPPMYIPILLFYSSSDQNPRKRSDLLKKSLSKTLAHFYTFAGRIKDPFTIDCNDQGATFIEAEIAFDMSIVLKDPTIDILLQLLPCDPLERLAEPSMHPLLAIQVNYFACGGMAICFCVRHVVADGSGAASFVKTWAAVASGGAVNFDGLVYDCTSLFPPQDLSGLRNIMDIMQNAMRAEVVIKRFVFDGSKIVHLRNKISNEMCHLYRPTRVEAVTALIWSAIIDSVLSFAQNHVANISVNLRQRLNPPLPQLCAGNFYHHSKMTISSVKEETRSLGSIAAKVHESVVKINDEFVKKCEYVDMLGEMAAAAVEKSREVGKFSFSSWCRFPFYETDFGWGKPVWFGTAVRNNKVALLLDTSDGQGVEAWIGLSKEEMAEFEEHPLIRAYASFKSEKCEPTILD